MSCASGVKSLVLNIILEHVEIDRTSLLDKVTFNAATALIKCLFLFLLNVFPKFN